MNKKIWILGILGLTLMIASVTAYTQGNSVSEPQNTYIPPCGGLCYGWSVLTDEQFEALQNKINELRNKNLTFQEFREELWKFRQENEIYGQRFMDSDNDGICDHYETYHYGYGGRGFGGGYHQGWHMGCF